MGMLVNPYQFGSGAPTVTLVASVDEAGLSEITHTFNGVNFGAAYAGRVLVFCTFVRRTTAPSFLSITAAGNACKIGARGASAAGFIAGAISYILDATNTSGSVVVTTGSSNSGWSLDVYAISGLTQVNTYSDMISGVSSGDPTGTLNVDANGVLIVGWGGREGTMGAVTWTGITSASTDRTYNAASLDARISTGLQAELSSEIGRTVTASATTTNEILLALSWGATVQYNSFNPYSKSSDTHVVLSNSNKTFTQAVASNFFTGCRSRFSATSGKYYWEFSCGTWSAVSTTQKGLGISSNAGGGNVIGDDSNLSMGYRADGIVRRNSTTLATYSTYTTGDVICIALDLDNNTIWFRKNNGDWNNNASNNPATNTGGLNISAMTGTKFPYVSGVRLNDAITIRTALADWTLSAPSGFGALGG